MLELREITAFWFTVVSSISNFSVGFVVPIPTLPFFFILIFSSDSVSKTISPALEPLLLMVLILRFEFPGQNPTPLPYCPDHFQNSVLASDELLLPSILSIASPL